MLDGIATGNTGNGKGRIENVQTIIAARVTLVNDQLHRQPLRCVTAVGNILAKADFPCSIAPCSVSHRAAIAASMTHLVTLSLVVQMIPCRRRQTA